MKHRFFAVTTLLTLMSASSAALAHAGHNNGTGFLSGLLHPFTGIDHLFVILSFGVMAGLWAGKRAGGLLVGFLILFTLSAFLGGIGAYFAGIETLLMGTVISAVALLLIRPLRGQQALVILFGLMAATTHGYVHGLELSAAAQSLGWLAGASLSVAIMLALSALTARTLSGAEKIPNVQ